MFIELRFWVNSSCRL